MGTTYKATTIPHSRLSWHIIIRILDRNEIIMGTELVPFYVQHSLKQLKVLPSQTLKKVIKVLYQKPQLKAGSQYNASAAYRHLPSVSVTDGGID